MTVKRTLAGTRFGIGVDRKPIFFKLESSVSWMGTYRRVWWYWFGSESCFNDQFNALEMYQCEKSSEEIWFVSEYSTQTKY